MPLYMHIAGTLFPDETIHDAYYYADIPADFAVLDELEGFLQIQEWLDEALDTLPVKLFEQVPYSSMSQALQLLLSDPITAERALQISTEGWQQLAQDLQQQALDELLQHPTWQDVRNTLASYCGKGNDRLEVETRLPALQAINNVEMGEEIKENLFIIDKLKVNFGSKKNWVEGGLEAVKKSVKELRDLVQNFIKAGLITLEIGAADEKLIAMLPA